MLVPRRFGLGRFQCINMVEKSGNILQMCKKHCNILQICVKYKIAIFCKFATSTKMQYFANLHTQKLPNFPNLQKNCIILQICNKYKNAKIAKFCKFVNIIFLYYIIFKCFMRKMSYNCLILFNTPHIITGLDTNEATIHQICTTIKKILTPLHTADHPLTQYME